MKISLIKEPLLQFNRGEYVCPKEGIAQFDVFGADKTGRRKEILLGCVGTDENNTQLKAWLEKCRTYIPGKSDTRLTKLFVPFCGFNPTVGFKSELVLPEENQRKISNSQVAPILRIEDGTELVNQAVELYAEQVKFLSEHRTLDVIVCVIPNDLFAKLTDRSTTHSDLESNFRRALKAKCMIAGGKPLQLIREASLNPNAARQQDAATKAWNFCTALYYKANQIGPWRLTTANADYVTCYVGVSFYQSRDRQSLHTSLAQVFDDMGRSMILRGTPISISKNDRTPHLSSEQASDLLERAIREFVIAMDITPARVVIHKSSNFNSSELDGFSQAISSLNVKSVDFVTIMPSYNTRLLRDGNYPPLRGTHLEIEPKRHLLYTRGTVEHYQTYPGAYVPQPLDIRVMQADSSGESICKEILGLTKMDWNNTQFDKKLPITLECAQNVGEIMKYLSEDDKPQGNYSYYM